MKRYIGILFVIVVTGKASGAALTKVEVAQHAAATAAAAVLAGAQQRAAQAIINKVSEDNKENCSALSNEAVPCQAADHNKVLKKAVAQKQVAAAYIPPKKAWSVASVGGLMVCTRYDLETGTFLSERRNPLTGAVIVSSEIVKTMPVSSQHKSAVFALSQLQSDCIIERGYCFQKAEIQGSETWIPFLRICKEPTGVMYYVIEGWNPKRMALEHIRNKKAQVLLQDITKLSKRRLNNQ
jgi:hypothetical protein